MKNNKSEKSIVLVKRLIKEHVRPYFGKLLLAAICMAIVAAATAGNAWLMQPVLDCLLYTSPSPRD